MRYAVLYLAAAVSVWGQSSEATISGIVTDPHGAVIAGAEVAATNIDTGVKTAARTNESGFYSLRSLPIGSYTVGADLAGFRRHVRNGIVLTTGQALELNIALELGAVSETVTVSASAPLLETRASDASQLVESKTVEDMPLGDRRAMNLIEITGGAVFGGYDGGSKPNFSLAGGRMQSQMFWIDGATGQNMRLGAGQIDVDPPIDTLQEVKVMANGFSAEFGGSAGGVVVATTKSGTNRLRGTASEYLRNQRLDAPNSFAPVADGRKDKPALRYNVFGATVGGPIRRDKTFFFASYEGSRRRDGSIRTLTVPTAIERAGDFSQTYNGRKEISVVYDPYTGRGSNPVVRDAFPGNRVPSSRFDKVALNLLPFYPMPNRPADDLTGANNFRANDVNALTRNNYLIKIDHNLGDNDKISGRYLYNSDISARRSVFPVPAADTVNDNDYHQQYWYGTWTRIISPATMNEARFTYSRRYSHMLSKGLGQGWPAKLGIQGVPDDAFPQINAGSFTDLGSGTQERRQFPIQQFQAIDNLTWVHGRHTVKLGGEYRPSFNYEVFRPSISGRFTFGRGMTGLPGSAQTGSPIATMLLGIVTNFEQRETQVLDRRTAYLAGFVQDDWLVHPGLTLNIGLRWETDTPMTDGANRINGFDPLATNPVSGTPGVVRFAGVNGWRTTPYDADWNNFGPRFGFAWRPFGAQKTVLRGGYGIFYAHPFDRAVTNAATLGYELSSTLILQENSGSIPYTLAGGLPIAKPGAPELDDSFGAVALGKTANTAVTFFETNRRSGYSQQFNMRVQQELPGRAVVEIGYLGNLSRKLGGANMNINQIRPELLQPTSNQRNRPFPQFSNVTVVAPALGVSAYHAGVVRFEKRFSRGLNILATYTWSKFVDNSGSGPGTKLGDEGNPYSDYYNRRNDWGPSENDVRHRVTWSSVYQIPIGKGRRYLAAHPLRHLLGNWQAGSVLVVQTGAPSTVQTQTNTTYSYSSGPQRADVLRDPNLPSGQRSITRWFDTGAFSQPGVNRFGNQGVGLVRCDGLWNWNGSLIRAFQLTERANLQFRGEFFNIPNHTNFGIPGHTFEGAGFGVVNSARPARQVQLGIRLTY